MPHDVVGEAPGALPVRVLELRSVWGTGGGPEKTILLGAAAADPTRSRVTVCYLRDARDAVFEIDDRAAAAGVDYVEIRERHSLDPGVWRPLVRLVRERRIDIVHAHDYKTDVLAWLLARWTGAIAMATAHAWTGHSRRERLLYYPADKRLLARFRVVLAVSHEIRRELTARGARPDRVRVLLNGIDPQAFRRGSIPRAAARARFGLAEHAVAIGAVGRLEPQKRFDLLVEAFARIRPAHPGAELIIAGEGSARGRILQAARDHGVAAACHLPGHLDEVITFHHALDLFVQSSAYEGTPNVVLEAMALETPIVATDVGGTAELARPAVDALIVPAGDVGALAQAIDAALGDREAARRRAARARLRVEQDLSFAARVRALDAIYEEVARPGHRP